MGAWGRGVRSVLAVFIVATLALVAPAGGAVAATRPAAPTHDQAVGQLRLYYRYVNARDYRRAYDLRGKALQGRQSFAGFSDGFSRTATNELRILGSSASGSLTIVRVQLDATLNDGGRQQFRGTYTIGRENGRFRIVDANLRVV